MAGPTPYAGKVFLITGAARGIGLGIAHYLAERGAILSLADYKEAELKTAEEQLTTAFPSSSLTCIHLDIRSSADVESWVSSTKARYGRIDGCVNNAGVMSAPAPLQLATDEDWDRVVGINLTGTFNCLRSELNHIVDGGSIINFSSMAGQFGLAGMGPYVATKHGIIGLSRTAAKEAAPRGIRVNVICPGVIDTPMLAELNEQAGGSITTDSLVAPQLLKRLGGPEDIAAAVGFLLGDESRFITSSVTEVAGGWGA
ncbi:BcABA4 [Thozetella sp. PMI_491]|nr:BcABA4 [Thozetella sp. PMI_491]